MRVKVMKSLKARNIPELYLAHVFIQSSRLFSNGVCTLNSFFVCDFSCIYKFK